jgi:hypothetical protein
MDKIAQELEIHSTIEEESFYPAAKNVRGGQSLVNEPNPNTRQSTPSCRGSVMSMETDEAVQKVKGLRAAVVHHATEEEG